MKKVMFDLLKGISVIGAILRYVLTTLVDIITLPFVTMWCLVVRVIIRKDDMPDIVGMVKCTYALKGAFIRCMTKANTIDELKMMWKTVIPKKLKA